jgi:hypothetical protein
MENGKRVSKEEKALIEKYKQEVFVSYQPSGYKDDRTEARILSNVFKGEIRKRSSGDLAMQFLLIEDQLKSHKSKNALKYVLHGICFRSDFLGY